MWLLLRTRIAGVKVEVSKLSGARGKWEDDNLVGSSRLAVRLEGDVSMNALTSQLSVNVMLVDRMSNLKA